MKKPMNVSVSNVQALCSITNGGLAKFEARWAVMSDKEKRELLHDIKRVSVTLGHVMYSLKREE